VCSSFYVGGAKGVTVRKGVCARLVTVRKSREGFIWGAFLYSGETRSAWKRRKASTKSSVFHQHSGRSSRHRISKKRGGKFFSFKPRGENTFNERKAYYELKGRQRGEKAWWKRGGPYQRRGKGMHV